MQDSHCYNPGIDIQIAFNKYCSNKTAEGVALATPSALLKIYVSVKLLFTEEVFLCLNRDHLFLESI